MEHNENDLYILIEEKLAGCDFKYICLFKQTEEGKSRIKQRVKELIFLDGITNLDTAFDKVDTQLEEEQLND
jgi:hypothetical protein